MFEKFKARVHETLETNKAEEMLTPEQADASRFREDLMKNVEASGVSVEGDVVYEKLGDVQFEEYPGSGVRMRIAGTFDGQNIDLQYTQVILGQQRKKWGYRDIEAVIEGAEVNPHEARALFDKYVEPAIASHNLQTQV